MQGGHYLLPPPPTTTCPGKWALPPGWSNLISRGQCPREGALVSCWLSTLPAAAVLAYGSGEGLSGHDGHWVEMMAMWLVSNSGFASRLLQTMPPVNRSGTFSLRSCFPPWKYFTWVAVMHRCWEVSVGGWLIPPGLWHKVADGWVRSHLLPTADLRTLEED